MSEANMGIEAMEGLAPPPFHPILTDASGGPTFTMLGTTMGLIATAAGSELTARPVSSLIASE